MAPLAEKNPKKHMDTQIGYNIFLSFLGNKKADDDDVKSSLVPLEGGIERMAEDVKED